MTTITLLPTPPSSSDTANFNVRADAFNLALPTFGTQVNAVAGEVNAYAANALVSATTATSAAAASGAIKWVTGTSYTEGDVRWSPTNYQAYRRKISGAGSTDPVSDSTNWARLDLGLGALGTLAILNGGTGQTTAPNALTALNGANRGANTDITSLAAITGIGFSGVADLQIVSGGNIGFGVTPSYKLDSYATSYNTMRIRSSISGAGGGASLLLHDGGGAGVALSYTGSTTNGKLYSSSQLQLESATSNIKFTTSSTDRLSVGSLGLTLHGSGTPINGVSSINSGALAGFRNRIINGGMSVDIRNNGGSYNIGYKPIGSHTTTPTCQLSQWFVYHTAVVDSGPVSLGRVTGASYSNARYRLSITGNANLVTSYLAQRLEAANVADLAGRVVNLSVEVSNTLLTTMSWAIYYANTQDGFGTPAVPARTLCSSGTWTISATSTIQTANMTLPTAATTGLEIVFSVSGQTSGSWFMSNVQLEPGSSATTFEQRHPALELELCGRYQRSLPANSCMGQVISTTAAKLISVGTAMRVTPTLAGVNLGGTTVSTASGANQAVTAMAVSAGSANEGSVLLDITVASGLVAGNACYLTGNLTSSNYLVAEL